MKSDFGKRIIISHENFKFSISGLRYGGSIKMTIKEFFGCTFIAFGLPFAMFLFTIARDPLRTIVLIAR